jgi:hypothetical protein
MGEVYILIFIGPEGTRWLQTMNPEVPEDLIRPGEMAFTVHPLDFKAKHSHSHQVSPVGWLGQIQYPPKRL